MARPLKQGIDYYPMDVGFLKDLKLRKIIRACGAASPVILIGLFSNIYKDYGYYLTWDGDMPFLIADEVGISEGAVLEVVKKAVQVGFFDQQLYESHSILTSKAIQRRFIHAISRRKSISVVQGYWLMLPEDMQEKVFDNINLVFVDINSVSANKNPVLAPGNSQSKEKESIEQKKEHPVTAGAATPKRPSKIFAEDSVEYKSSQFLIKKILERDSGARVPKTEEQIQSWCVHVDRILRLDKRPPDQLRDVLAFAVKDTFWSGVVLSTKGLRDKFDQLVAHMQRPKGKPNIDPRNNVNKNYDGDIFD